MVSGLWVFLFLNPRPDGSPQASRRGDRGDYKTALRAYRARRSLACGALARGTSYAWASLRSAHPKAEGARNSLSGLINPQP
jgi:hypothetical protein